MFRRVIPVAVATVLTVTGSLAVTAADTVGEVDATALEALCAANAPDDGALDDCLTVVHHYLVPGSGPTIGDRVEEGGLGVTLADVAWDAEVAGVVPTVGETFVAIHVTYEALEDADYSALDDWHATDPAGDRLERVTPGVEPELGAGTLASGETVDGWITFRAPDDLPMIDVTYSDGIFGAEHEFLVPSGVTAAGGGDGPTPTAAPAVTPTPTAKPTPAPTPKPLTYATLSERGWKRLVKNPDAYTGRRYVLYACIWQFDGATGPEEFLATASYHKPAYWYVDSENAAFTGNASQLDAFVEGDVVWMRVISLGSYSYDTQAGGNTTVPAFEVVQIKRQSGSC